jgi:hypothetical protein
VLRDLGLEGETDNRQEVRLRDAKGLVTRVAPTYFPESVDGQDEVSLV